MKELKLTRSVIKAIYDVIIRKQYYYFIIEDIIIYVYSIIMGHTPPYNTIPIYNSEITEWKLRIEGINFTIGLVGLDYLYITIDL